MESIKQWLQDWSDACEYAKECVPDLSFFSPQEPYSTLLGIAAICFAIWWWNERGITRLRKIQDRSHLNAQEQLELAGRTKHLRQVSGQMQSISPGSKRLRADELIAVNAGGRDCPD